MRATRLVPAHRRGDLRALLSRSRQVALVAALVGAATGLLVAALDWLVIDVMFERVARRGPLLIATLPAAGLLLGLLVRRTIGGGVSGATADEYLHAFHDHEYTLSWRPLVARLVAAVATVGLGSPMGLEGPSLYGGATIGAAVQRRLPKVFRAADRRTLLVAGAAAAVAAIFKAPATGAVFALEVPYQDDIARRMLLPALVAAATGYLGFVAVHGTAALFPVNGSPAFNVGDLLGAIGVGVVAAIGARAFAWMLRYAKDLAAGPRPIATTVAAGMVLGAAFAGGRLLTGESLVVGPGYSVVDWARQPGHATGVLAGMLALRCLATAAAVAGGGTGGLFVPLVAGGALTGALVHQSFGLGERGLFVLVGVAAFLGAGYRVPLAAVMFVAETSGRPSFVVPGVLAAVAAELLMGRSSVTRYQRRPGEHQPELTTPTEQASTIEPPTIDLGAR